MVIGHWMLVMLVIGYRLLLFVNVNVMFYSQWSLVIVLGHWSLATGDWLLLSISLLLVLLVICIRYWLLLLVVGCCN